MEGVKDGIGVEDEITNGGVAIVGVAVNTTGIGEGISLIHDANVRVPKTHKRYRQFFVKARNLISKVTSRRM